MITGIVLINVERTMINDAIAGLRREGIYPETLLD